MDRTLMRLFAGLLCTIASLAIAVAAIAHPLWTVFWRQQPLDTATFLILAGASTAFTAAAAALFRRRSV